MNKSIILEKPSIKDKIRTIRNLQIILDEDLAIFYNVPTKRLNEQVRRNIKRFPERYMFQLTEQEANNLRSQFATSRWGGRRKLPYAFTEQGVAMLSGVLKSETAINVSVQIIDAFVAMRKFIADNADVFFRLNTIEQKQLEHDKTFEEVFNAIQTKENLPDKGIFFEGQIFDAYKFVSDIIKKAEKSLILIDNYVDESILTLLTKCKKGVQITIFTGEISKQLALDLTKYSSQYNKIEAKIFKHSHDRFIIIDNKEIYHIGASLKDLGKKWFAFSRFDKETIDVLKRLDIQS